MKVKRGDIFWIEQNKYRPAVGHVQNPGRPGIVVSNDANNAFAFTYEIVYLTGKPKKALPTHCTITSAARPSIALCEQITTVSDEQIREYVGHCTDAEMAEIDRCIAISLGLPEPGSYTQAATDETDYDREEFEETIKQQENELAIANARLEMMQEMYNNLLERTIR